MSTRAVYTFANFEANNFKDISFYVHQDGYPEGAAKYFEAMLYFANLSEPPEPIPMQFVYAVKDLGLNPALQTNRLAAPDLEWGYTITEDHNVTVHRIKNGTETQHWSGSLDQFLNKYL
tara:strand:- start:338 stop:694 length:357 start_codon:yes stop_codon:yes gene_type:complete